MNSPSPRQFLCNKILLKTLAAAQGMRIEQIFELRGSELSGHIYTSITGCFHEKTIISRKNFPVNCYLLLKYCRKQCTLITYRYQSNHLKKFKPKMQDFKRVLDLNCKQKED